MLITFLFISYDFEITVDINGRRKLMHWSKSMFGTKNSSCSPDTVISTSRQNSSALKETENLHLVFYVSQKTQATWTGKLVWPCECSHKNIPDFQMEMDKTLLHKL